jgi:hypothetical protein
LFEAFKEMGKGLLEKGPFPTGISANIGTQLIELAFIIFG